MIIAVILNGDLDYNAFTIEATPDQVEFLQRIAALSVENSEDEFHPTLEVLDMDETDP